MFCSPYNITFDLHRTIEITFLVEIHCLDFIIFRSNEMLNKQKAQGHINISLVLVFQCTVATAKVKNLKQTCFD